MDRYVVIAKHAINHKAIEYCRCAKIKDALDVAQNLAKLGLDGEIHYMTSIGAVKETEWFWNEELQWPKERA